MSQGQFVASFVEATGVQVEVKRGERLPEDIANAVLYAVTQPIDVNVAEIVPL